MPQADQHRLGLVDLIELTGGSVEGDPAEPEAGYVLVDPAAADAGAVAVVWTREALDSATRAGAGLLVIPQTLRSAAGDRPLLLVQDARLAFARISARLAGSLTDPSGIPVGISARASVHPDASVHATASIADFVTVAAGAVVGAGTVLGPGSSLGRNSRLGQQCRLHAGVHVQHGVTIGDRVIIHSGAVIGSDGFGFVATSQGPVRIEHLGSVTIGNDVEIGANTTIDRATLGATSIGDRTKLDNLVQVGHNVTIGSDCLIAGQSAIGGSTSLGDRVTLGGNAAISDHVVIEDDAIIGALSGVSKRVPAGEFWFGIPAMPHRSFARRQYLQGRLEEIWQHVREVRRR